MLFRDRRDFPCMRSLIYIVRLCVFVVGYRERNLDYRGGNHADESPQRRGVVRYRLLLLKR